MALQEFNNIKNQKYLLKTPFVIPANVLNALPSQITTPLKTFGGNILKKQLFKIFGNIKRGQAKDNTKVTSELDNDSVNSFNNKPLKNDFNDLKKVQYLKLSDIQSTDISYNLLLTDISFDTKFNNNLMFTKEGNQYYIERSKIENIIYNVSFTFLSPHSTTFKNENKSNVNVSNTYNLSGLEHTNTSNAILVEDFLNQNRAKFIIFDFELLNMFGYLLCDTLQINSKQDYKNLTEISVSGIFTKNNAIFANLKVKDKKSSQQRSVLEF